MIEYCGTRYSELQVTRFSSGDFSFCMAPIKHQMSECSCCLHASNVLKDLFCFDSSKISAYDQSFNPKKRAHMHPTSSLESVTSSIYS